MSWYTVVKVTDKKLMSISEDLAWRGLIKDTTFSDMTWLDEPKTLYWGLDASADSLTIGHIPPALLARRLIQAGWNAVILAGGATSLVGDPGGKSQERELKPKEEIAKNIEGVKAQLEKLFAGASHQIVNNIDWLANERLLDFLRDTGKYFPMNELLQREFVTERLETGISYAEFSYSLLQGYDFWWLFKNKEVVLQVGASDQWGNMLSGVGLIRKKEGAEAHALSMPLVINKTTGVKFGKSEVGAIWLDSSRTSPHDFYQFWINVPDEDVEEYLKIFTVLRRNQIEDIMAKHLSNPAARTAQATLAEQVTELVHGSEALRHAQGHAETLKASPSGSGEAVILPSGVSLVQALIETGLVASNTEARRLIEDGGIYVNDQPSNQETLEAGDFDNGRLRLRRGKKLQNSALVELN